MVAGDFQAELDRAGGQDEVVQARRLRLPAEPADPLVLLPADPAGDLGEAGVLDLRRGLQHVVGDRVDEAGAEEGGRVALGVEQGELAGPALGPVDAREPSNCIMFLTCCSSICARWAFVNPPNGAWHAELAHPLHRPSPRFVVGIGAEPMQDDAPRGAEARVGLDQLGRVRGRGLARRPRRGGLGPLDADQRLQGVLEEPRGPFHPHRRASRSGGSRPRR